MGKVKLSRVCVLCRKDVNDELKFGPLKRTKLMRVHYYCLLLSETISQSGQDDEGILGFMASDIVKELNLTKNLKCCYCHESPATIGCADNACNRKFHLHCGYENNAVFNFDKFNARCHLHTKPSNVPSHIKRCLSDYHCLICLEMFDSETKISDVIWANCCKSNVMLHSNCVRQMTLNAGYFTKCPGCNDKTKFISTIKQWSVFVPERDASWELDGNAFSELLYVHSKCDQKSCSCPDGREFSEENGKWKIMLCKMCGSVGAHVACSELKRRFTCDVCNLNASSAVERECNNSEVVDLSTVNDDYDDVIEIEVIDEPGDDFANQQGVETIENFNFEMQDNDIEPHDHNRNTPEKKKCVHSNNLRNNAGFRKKRSFEAVDNSDENKDSTKKFRKDIGDSKLNGNAGGYQTIPETILIEDPSPSYTVLLDDNSEVEFISCSDANSFSSESDNGELFLDALLPDPEEKKDECNKENEINSNILQSCDVQQNFILEGASKSNKKVVELNFRNYQNCAEVSF